MGTTTFIAIVDFSVSPAERPACLAHLTKEQPTVRAMPGCVSFRPFPSPDDDTGITVLHEWTDQAAFDRYLASEVFRRSSEVLRPRMIGQPSSRRFRGRLVETVG